MGEARSQKFFSAVGASVSSENKGGSRPSPGSTTDYMSCANGCIALSPHHATLFQEENDDCVTKLYRSLFGRMHAVFPSSLLLLNFNHP